MSKQIKHPRIVCANHESYSMGDKIVVFDEGLDLQIGDEAVIGLDAYPVRSRVGNKVGLSENKRRLSERELAEVAYKCKWHWHQETPAKRRALRARAKKDSRRTKSPPRHRR